MISYTQLFLLTAFLVPVAISNASAGGRTGTVEVNIQGSKLRVSVLTPKIVRVTMAAGVTFSSRASLSCLPVKENMECKETERGHYTTIYTGSVYVEINKLNGSVSFFDKNHKRLLRSAPKDKSTFTRAVVAGENVFHIKQGFKITKDEGLFGLGQFEDPMMNYRGKDILIAQANRTAVNPFLVSTNGYGILWDNPSESRFHDGSDGIYFWSEVADQIDYYFVYGPTIDEEIGGYRRITGQAPMYGKWAYGYWQSKERYQTSSELMSVVKEYRERKIPLDNIVQDWQYWGDMDQFSGMIWDSTRYPHPEAMIDSLHDLHAHLMVTIWPAFGRKSEIYQEMEKDNFLFTPDHWCGGKVYDAWNPDARDVYWKYIRNGLFSVGVDAFWMDATEPELRCTDDRYITKLSLEEAGRNYLGTNARYLNSYSLQDTRGIYDHQREVTDKKRVFILTRSTYTGQQRYAAATWSGDTFASWDALKTQVAAAINFCMSGLPYWTNDIGGFVTAFNYPNGVKDDAYKELYVRWFQFGAFNPLFRSHGTNTPREVWKFGSKGDWAYDALVKFDNLRYRLMPYIYSLAWKVTQDGYTIMRGLPMDFPRDRKTYSIGNQFMFGPSIMVCPITKPIFHQSEYKGIDITPDHFYSADGKEHGTQLDVYRGTDFNELVLSRKFEASQISWTGCLPEGLDTSYSVKIAGKIRSEVKGKYEFYVLTNAGVRLWINDKLLIDKWDNKDDSRFEAEIYLDANKKYDFKLFHKQFRPNTAYLKINWVTPKKNRDSRRVDVYLPKNNLWYDFWTGKTLTGGKNVLVDAPINMIPIFVPAGSIIPVGPEIQYAAEEPADPIELRIYRGKDGSFELYEDENDNYDYESGVYSTIRFTWNDETKTITIGDRKGEFPGMLKERTFNIVLVSQDHGTGVDSTQRVDRVVKYDGRGIEIKF